MTGVPAEAAPRRQLARSGAVVAAGTALSRITGFLRIAALAALGFSRLTDVYNIANSTPNIVYELLLGGILTASLVPIFIEHHQRDDDHATDAVTTVSAVALMAVSIVGVLLAPWIAALYSSRLRGGDVVAQQELMTDLLRMFMPQIFFYGVTALLTAMLNARRRFAAAAFAPALNNLIVIGVLLALPRIHPGRESVGSVLGDRGGELLLGLGTTLGVVAMTVVLWPALRRAGVRLHWVWELRHPAVRRLIRLSGWTVGYAIANQIAFWIVLVLSYRTAGDTSAYLAAFTFFQLPHGLFTVSVITVIGPELARAAIARDEAAFRRRYASGLRIVALVALPAGVLMSVLAEPIVRGALDHGGFREASVTTTAATLAWFGIGLIGFSGYLYTVRAMYAHLDTRTPFLVNLLENAINIGLAILLYPSMGVRGLALAWTVAYAVAAVVAWCILDARVGGLEGRRTLGALVRIGIATGAAALLAHAIDRALAPTDAWSSILTVVAGGGVGMAVAIGGAALLRVHEIADLRTTLARTPRADG